LIRKFIPGFAIIKGLSGDIEKAMDFIPESKQAKNIHRIKKLSIIHGF
jgi:hypothetical protein